MCVLLLLVAERVVSKGMLTLKGAQLNIQLHFPQLSKSAADVHQPSYTKLYPSLPPGEDYDIATSPRHLDQKRHDEHGTENIVTQGHEDDMQRGTVQNRITQCQSPPKHSSPRQHQDSSCHPDYGHHRLVPHSGMEQSNRDGTMHHDNSCQSNLQNNYPLDAEHPHSSQHKGGSDMNDSYESCKPLVEHTASADKEIMSSDTVEVTGLPADATKDALTLFFESEQCTGGTKVDNINIDAGLGRALVKFRSESGNLCI